MYYKRLWTALAVVLVLTIAVGIASAERARPETDKGFLGCSLQGTWYGYNTEGDGNSYVMTITRTGFGKFSAVGQEPAVPLDPAVYPGAEAPYSTQGELTRTGPGRYDSTWMSIFKLDPSIWVVEASALVSIGEIVMTSCDTWEATFTWGTYGHFLGEDPLDGRPAHFTGTTDAFYRRLPQLSQLP